MTYQEYIAYHKRGDAGVEERTIAALCRTLALSDWDAFRLIYYYTMTYHIPSALLMLRAGAERVPRKRLNFRTDRRYVRCGDNYARLLRELTPDKQERLQELRTTEGAYNEVRDWYFFGRYAAYLFLEVYCNVFRPGWLDNIKYGWEANENYTKGAELICGTKDRTALDAFLERAKKDTGDNAFAIETSLCAVAKFAKGTRWDGFYTERMLNEADESPYRNLIYKCL